MIQRCLLCWLVLAAACQEPLRLPYIRADLQDWPERYTGTDGLTLHGFHTGTAEIPERMAYRGGSLAKRLTLDIPAFAIEHPRHGIVLVGTGLNRQIAIDHAGHLGPLRAALTTFCMAPGQELPTQLAESKLPVDKVRLVILPDLRLDHSGEVESFPSVPILVSRTEHEAAMGGNRAALYLGHEYDQVRDWKLVDFVAAKPLGTLPAHIDLFGDGSVLLVDVTGATAGGLAVLVRLPEAPVLLTGNLAWTKDQYHYVWQPGLSFDRQAWWDKAWRLKKWMELAPELVILPDHDWAAIQAADLRHLNLHEFERSEADIGDGQPGQESLSLRQTPCA